MSISEAITEKQFESKKALSIIAIRHRRAVSEKGQNKKNKLNSNITVKIG